MRPRFSAALCRGLIEALSPSDAPKLSQRSFPRLYAAASLKPQLPAAEVPRARGFSAALCRGLIEAIPWRLMPLTPGWRFPRLYAAASLKLVAPRSSVPPRILFSAALCRGLIEARHLQMIRSYWLIRFSAALCRGLIEAIPWRLMPLTPGWRFPRLYAAASLKLDGARTGRHGYQRFPRLYAAASLKLIPNGRDTWIR